MHFATKEQFQNCYDKQWQEVIESKKELDPLNVFGSGFQKDYFTQKNMTNNKFNKKKWVKKHNIFWRDTFKFQKVFRSIDGRIEFSKFLDNIFLKLNNKKFYAIIDEILGMKSICNDTQFYMELLKRINAAKYGFIKGTQLKLQSLRQQKDDISSQVAAIMDGNCINGYLEIGYPDRMVNHMKAKMNITGKIVVINTEKYITDYIEACFPLPYDKILTLNNYDPIDENKLKKNTFSR